MLDSTRGVLSLTATGEAKSAWTRSSSCFVDGSTAAIATDTSPSVTSGLNTVAIERF